ncbi:hypothetical protein AB6A40_001601 [Gnathostoma spinigerum]|uniref:Uncharacterized protein n=1 Tax=Gnathostoma spinigerum TaxID=75299 RepID=A0ABD6E6M1_9BILA
MDKNILRRLQWLLINADIRKRLRQLPISRRIAFFIIFLLCLVYILMSCLSFSSKHSSTDGCLREKLDPWRKAEENSHVSTSNSDIFFIGNGYIGMGNDEQIRIRPISARIISLPTDLYPLISILFKGSASKTTGRIIDYREGMLHDLLCFSEDNTCFCVERKVYAHRTRPNLFVQSIVASNPSGVPLRLNLSMKGFQKWERIQRNGNEQLYKRMMDVDGTKLVIVAICTNLGESISVASSREESLQFICAFHYETLTSNTDSADGLKTIENALSKKLSDALGKKSSELDDEHSFAWHELNKVAFGLAVSFAPDALNPSLINATHHALLSHSRAPVLEVASTDEERKEVRNFLQKQELCYSGHSTLLIPSRLWKKSTSVEECTETVNIWMHTLEKRGCFSLLRAGAVGISQAFSLSLIAARFGHEHFEINIDPADIHRDITVDNLSFLDHTNISIHFHLDDEYRPYVLVSSSTKVYACSAACLDPPLAIGKIAVKLPIKITRPLTSILYIAEKEEQLEQLKGTIHIAEVMNAPAQEQDIIALHRHGHRLGGLPTIFWILLFGLVIAFHLFLVKLLYSEWKKGDSVPYNYYLRQRYIRTH